MKLFIVENESFYKNIEFFDYARELGWDIYNFSVTMKDSADIKDIKKFLKTVCEARPDIVILDAALTTTEEKLLDRLRLGVVEIFEDSLSGFRYCQALSNERLGIPIVFFTKVPDGPVARVAMRVGADRVLSKRTQNKALAYEIQELVNAKTPHDSKFYWSMREHLEAHSDIWQGEALRNALDRFFLKPSNARRFGLFTASLRGILSPLFQGNIEVEKKLMLNLVKSQVILSLADPQLRDHVKHTGNVFWMGYRLLHDIAEFNDPTSLDGSIPELYGGSDGLSAKEQVLYAWTLAALFHDYGYVDERQDQLIGLVANLVPDISLAQQDVRNESSWQRNIRRLRDFVGEFLGNDHFLYHFIDTVMTSFGTYVKCQSANNKKVPLIDHGFLSAHRLLDMLPFETLDISKRNIVLHAALAVALHNSTEMRRKWFFEEKCHGHLSVGTFPVCSLLAFCDTVQTWDRELDIDPVVSRTEAYDGFLERLVLSDTSYVSGSEICEFKINLGESPVKYNLEIRLRYFVDTASGIKDVCEKLSDDIRRWIDSDRLNLVCEMMGISSLLKGRIIYELPMLAGTQEALF